MEVDEAYWQIVALQSKKRLAESYLQLVQKLDNDVQLMIGEGFATKADGLSVKVKVNEAKVTMIQVDNGLALSRMLLCLQPQPRVRPQYGCLARCQHPRPLIKK